MKLYLKTLLNNKPVLLISVITAFYFIVEFFWKPPFMDGRAVGIYKLFVFLDKTDARLAILMMILSILLFSIYFLLLIILKRNHPQLLLIFFQSFICSLILGFTWFYQVHQGMPYSAPHQLDNIEAQGKVYYLASYQTDSIEFDYRLYECDSWDIVCKLVHCSDDAEYPTYNAGTTLQYNQSNKEIIVMWGKKPIYEYKIP